MSEDRRNCTLLFGAIFAVTLALRLCHAHILWADEDYHLAAAIQTLHGKLLYRDVWYDKPPLSAWVYTAIGGLAGWPLRVFDALYVLAVCAAVWHFAVDVWGRREAMVSAALMAFFLNFDLPAAVLPIAPDFFLLLPHILAVHCAWKGKPLRAGLWCGVAFLFHTKGVFVLAACALLLWRSAPVLLAGFAIPNVVALVGLGAGGALPQYYRQVWEWGAAYARSSPEGHPFINGLRRTADWAGFHGALVVGAALAIRKNLWIWGWLAVSLVGVVTGGRFFPRYFLEILPPMVMMAARGAGVLWGGQSWPRTGFRAGPAARKAAAGRMARPTVPAALMAALLLVPLVRFAPRYFAAGDPQWNDTALDRDSRAAAERVNGRKHPGDTLFVWGYRPGIFVYTRMPVGSRFWDSQPLTGVPADRHLREAVPVFPEQAIRNRQEFAGSRPTFVVDSLSLSNPSLAIDTYPELHEWFAQYRLVARTSLSLIYQRLPGVAALRREDGPFHRP